MSDHEIGFDHETMIFMQRAILAEIQARHLDTLKDAGLVDKVAELLGQDPTQLGQVMVSVHHIKAGQETSSSLNLVAAQYHFGEDGSEIKSYKYVGLALRIEDMTVPAEDFSEEDVYLVAVMADELQALKDEAILPNLQSNLMDIVDTSTGISSTRPQ